MGQLLPASGHNFTTTKHAICAADSANRRHHCDSRHSAPTLASIGLRRRTLIGSQTWSAIAAQRLYELID